LQDPDVVYDNYGLLGFYIFIDSNDALNELFDISQMINEFDHKNHNLKEQALSNNAIGRYCKSLSVTVLDKILTKQRDSQEHL